MENQEFERCPFCGADIEKKVVFAQPRGIHPQNDCHLKGKIMSAVHWNRRAPLQVEEEGEPRQAMGYALAMRVLQSDLYAKLDDEERGECDALIRAGVGEPHQGGEPGTALELVTLREIAHLVGAIYYYGGFHAETYNERVLEEKLRAAGYRYRSEEEILAAQPPAEAPEADPMWTDGRYHLSSRVVFRMRDIVTKWDQYQMRDGERPGSQWAAEMLSQADDAYDAMVRDMRAPEADGRGA